MSDTDGTDEPSAAASHGSTESRDDDRANLFERFFPGPSPQDPRVAARLEAIARAQERRVARQSARAKDPTRTRPPRNTSIPGPPPSAPETTPSAPRATSEDLDRLVDAMHEHTDAVHEQTDVIRALLDADVAIRDDARATAQNSRTFAIAGIVIAFGTLVAAVVTVVVAFAE